MIKVCFGFLLAALMGTTAQAQGFLRMEMIPIPSVTLKTEQILTGDLNGKPVTVAGQLRIPKAGTDKLAAIIMVHGSGGLSASAEAWAREFNSIGMAVLVLDSFAGRGIVSTVNDQSQLDHLAMAVDAYRALGVLAAHPRVDPARIAIIGFSKGAVAAVYSANTRFRKLLGPSETEFAAHVGLYTPCNTAFRDDDKVTGKPIRMHHGIPDDWVSIEPCRAYAARLKQAGADVALAEYEGAYHAYDNASLVQPVKFPQAQTSRNCSAREANNGVIVNAKTGAVYSLADPCIERGAQVAYNEAAHKATVAAVKDFLATTFKLKE